MADFRRNTGRGRGPSRGAPRGRPRGDSSRGRDSFRGNRGRDNDRGKKLEFTKVTCSTCGEQTEVPFRPTAGKPVLCKECFDGGSKPKGSSNKELEIINMKLDKIMKALKIN